MGFIRGLIDGFSGAPPRAPLATIERGMQVNDLIGGSASTLMLGGSLTSGALLRRGTSQVLKAYNESPNLRRVVSLLAHSLASTSWYLERPKRAKGSRGFSLAEAAGGRRLRTRAVAQKGERVDVHPFLDFLGRGSPILPGLQSFKASFAYNELAGEFFWVLLGDENKSPDAWFLVPPTWVRSIPSPGVNHYTLDVGNHSIQIPAEHVFYSRDPDLENPYARGVGMGRTLGDELDSDEYAAKLLKHVLANKGFHDVLIAVKGASDATMKDVEARYNNRHRGYHNSGRGVFFDAEKMDVKTVTQSMAELRLLELRQWEWNILRETFGIPPELLGQVENSNRATILEANRIFARQVLIPRLESLRMTMQAFLLPRWPELKGWIIDYESPEPNDAERRLEVMRAHPSAFTENEWRAEAGLPAAPWGEERYLTPAPTVAPAPAAPATKSVHVRRALDFKDIETILSAAKTETVVAGLKPLWKTHTETIAKKEGDRFGISFDLVNPLLKEHVEQFAGTRIADINATTLNELRGALAAGIEAGEGVDKLAKRISGVYENAGGYRAELIARTETVRSANLAQRYVWEATGLPLVVEWIATRDGRVRASHLALDGKVVGLNESFSFDAGLEPYKSGSTKGPGDSGVAAHDCNCRCTVAALDPDDVESEESEESEASLSLGKERADAIWKSFEATITPWETEAARLLARNFEQQEKDVLAILNRLT